MSAHGETAAVVITHSSRTDTINTAGPSACYVQIDAKPSLPHGEHSSPKSKKIFVGGLAPETTEGEGALRASVPATGGGSGGSVSRRRPTFSNGSSSSGPPVSAGGL